MRIKSLVTSINFVTLFLLMFHCFIDYHSYIFLVMLILLKSYILFSLLLFFIKLGLLILLLLILMLSFYLYLSLLCLKLISHLDMNRHGLTVVSILLNYLLQLIPSEQISPLNKCTVK